jgi:hypothetical protein
VFQLVASSRFTGSQWDHAGIVLRWADNGLKLFEATAGGVGLYNLQVRRNVFASWCLTVRGMKKFSRLD